MMADRVEWKSKTCYVDTTWGQRYEIRFVSHVGTSIIYYFINIFLI